MPKIANLTHHSNPVGRSLGPLNMAPLLTALNSNPFDSPKTKGKRMQKGSGFHWGPGHEWSCETFDLIIWANKWRTASETSQGLKTDSGGKLGIQKPVALKGMLMSILEECAGFPKVQVGSEQVSWVFPSLRWERWRMPVCLVLPM